MPTLTRTLVVFAFVLCFAACPEGLATHEVQISPQTLQEALEIKLPIERAGKLGAFALRDPKLLVDPETGKIGLELRVEVQVKEVRIREKVLSAAKSTTGRFGLQGALAYEDGAFFLRSPDVSAFEIEGLSEKTNAWLKKAVEKAARSLLDTTPVHTLQLAEAKQSVAKMVLKSTSVEADGNLHVVLGL